MLECFRGKNGYTGAGQPKLLERVKEVGCLLDLQVIRSDEQQ
jgi:hypothetical protein